MSASNPPAPPATDARPEFYVGYLPLPWGHSRFLRWFIPLSLWVVVVAASVAAWGMRSPGDGTWAALATPAETVSITGIAVSEPYAMLLVADLETAGAPREAVLVVEEGKFGAQERFADHAGRPVTATGWLIERDGRRMLEVLEVEPRPAGGPEIAVDPQPEPDPRSPSPVTLAGELMDGKCHLGVMKPGDGKGHKACAILCIRGGIPPLLRMVEDDGTVRHVLVTGPDGARCPDDVVVLAGGPITLTGTLGWIGDLPTIAVAAAASASE